MTPGETALTRTGASPAASGPTIRSIAPLTALSATGPGNATRALAAEIMVIVWVTCAWRIAPAGVGKQTIYRWWPSRADVLLEAGAAQADLQVPVTDHGSYPADLRAFLEASYQMAGSPHLADLLRTLMTEAQIDLEFAARFRAAFLFSGAPPVF